jgi:phosphosulfolactate synthase (CoM biosynthesis protein A)
MDVYCVPVEAVEPIWVRVEPYFKRALGKHDAEYSLEDIKQYVLDKKWKLFVSVNDDNTVNGAAVVSFLSYPKSYVAFVTCLGGRMLINKECFEKFVDLLRGYGADRLQGYVTDSIERLYKRINVFRKSVMVEMKL